MTQTLHSSEILNSLQPAGSQSWVHGSRDGTDLAKLQGVHLRRHFGRWWRGVVRHKDGRKLRYSNIFEEKHSQSKSQRLKSLKVF